MSEQPTEEQIKLEREAVRREFADDRDRLAFEIVVLRHKLVACREQLYDHEKMY